MNTTHAGRNEIGLRERFRVHRHRRRFKHDPWLVLNMATFNFAGGWNRTLNLPSGQRGWAMLAHMNSARIKRSLGFEVDERVDEALRSAYQRYDKRAVTKELLQRYLQPSLKPRVARRKVTHG